MFFEKEDLTIKILDVIELDQKNINMRNVNRNFNALSFRISADTLLDTGDKKYQLADNSICFVPAYIEYSRISNNDKMIVVHFDTINYFSNEIEFFQTCHAEIYETLFKEMLNYWNAKEDGYIYQCTSIFHKISYECHKENYFSPESINPIYPSVKFIENNFKNPNITIDEIAKQSFMSTVYFRKLFRKIYGISPIKYVINLRIKYAINLIETEYYSLYEVSKLSGYDDYSYFSSEFKRITGISPSKYLYNYKL